MEAHFCSVCGVVHEAQGSGNGRERDSLWTQENDEMLHYSKMTAPPLHDIAGTVEEKSAFLEAFARRHAGALEVFGKLVSRNREGEVPNRMLQPYFCVGCDVGDGALRAEILGFGAYPLHQTALQELTRRRLVLQCYFAQTYEVAAGTGPGGIIGSMEPRDVGEVDATASRAWKYWQWVDEHLPAYVQEEEAEFALGKLSYIAFSRGKAWLAGLPAEIPVEGVLIPSELVHDIHALLGVAAMQRLVARHLKKDLVMLNARTVVRRKDLRWDVNSL